MVPGDRPHHPGLGRRTSSTRWWTPSRHPPPARVAFSEHATTSLIRDRMAAVRDRRARADHRDGGSSLSDGGLPSFGRPAGRHRRPAQSTRTPPRPSAPTSTASCTRAGMTSTSLALGVAPRAQPASRGTTGRYVFLFQPAEEALAGPGGWWRRRLDLMPGAALVGFHVTSQDPTGVWRCATASPCPRAHSLRITLSGPGGPGPSRVENEGEHGTLAQRGVAPVVELGVVDDRVRVRPVGDEGLVPVEYVVVTLAPARSTSFRRARREPEFGSVIAQAPMVSRVSRLSPQRSICAGVPPFIDGPRGQPGAHSERGDDPGAVVHSSMIGIRVIAALPPPSWRAGRAAPESLRSSWRVNPSRAMESRPKLSCTACASPHRAACPRARSSSTFRLDLPPRRIDARRRESPTAHRTIRNMAYLPRPADDRTGRDQASAIR